MRHRPLVAIVGRPNVGKSTLFNMIIGERRAVVHDLPGMTRDRHFADAEYRMRPCTLIDTGGYEDGTGSTLLQQMRAQSIIAMEEAESVIFLTDVQEPYDPVDTEILERLRSSGRPFFLVVNKCDNQMLEAQAYADFSRFGLDQVYPVSALHGRGLYDLLDDVTKDFEEWDPDKEDKEEGPIRVAIVGKQNAGKSTLVNKLVGHDRVIANSLAGTTRDAIDAEVTVDGQDFVLIDTAGIRRRGKVEKGPEKLSVHSSFRAIERAQVALLLIDCSEGITAQDQHIAGYVLEKRKSCIILLNKWDMVEDREKKYGEMLRHVRQEFNFMPWAPIITVSALTGQRTHKIWDIIKHCAENFAKHFTTSQLNLILRKATSYITPPTARGNNATLKYVTQIRSHPPTLMIFVNDPDFIHFSYRRYLANQFYHQLGLEGTPLILRFRRKAPPRGWEQKTGMRGERTEEQNAALLQRDGQYYAGVYFESGEDVGDEVNAGLEENWEVEFDDFEDNGDDE